EGSHDGELPPAASDRHGEHVDDSEEGDDREEERKIARDVLDLAQAEYLRPGFGRGDFVAAGGEASALHGRGATMGEAHDVCRETIVVVGTGIVGATNGAVGSLVQCETGVDAVTVVPCRKCCQADDVQVAASDAG